MDNDCAPLYQPLSSTKLMKADVDAVGESVPMAAQNTSVGIMPPMMLGPNNTLTICSYCQATVKTSIKHTVTTRTHFMAAIWCFFCCCCCIPYCMTSARNSDHYCPSCNRFLGTYEK